MNVTKLVTLIFIVSIFGAIGAKSFAGEAGTSLPPLPSSAAETGDAAALYSLLYPKSGARCAVSVEMKPRSFFQDPQNRIRFFVDGNVVFTTQYHPAPQSSKMRIISDLLEGKNIFYYGDGGGIYVSPDRLISMYKTYHCDSGQSGGMSKKPAAESDYSAKIDTCAMIGIFHSTEDGSNAVPKQIQDWAMVSYSMLRGAVKDTTRIEEGCQTPGLARFIHERQEKILKNGVPGGNKDESPAESSAK